MSVLVGMGEDLAVGSEEPMADAGEMVAWIIGCNVGTLVSAGEAVAKPIATALVTVGLGSVGAVVETVVTAFALLFCPLPPSPILRWIPSFRHRRGAL